MSNAAWRSYKKKTEKYLLDLEHESYWRLGWEEFRTGLKQIPRLVGSLCWYMQFRSHIWIGVLSDFQAQMDPYTNEQRKRRYQPKMTFPFSKTQVNTWDSHKSKIVLLWQNHLISIQNHVYLVQYLPFDWFWYKILKLIEETLTLYA